MTDTTISNVKNKAMFIGNAGNYGKVQKGQEQECFSAVFDKTQNFSKENEENTFVKKEATEETAQECTNIRESKASRELQEQSKEAKGVKQKDVAKAAEEIVEEVANTFGITVEEVENILGQLGLTVVDLLNPENLTQVVLALNPECDVLSLMTDEDLFADLKRLMDFAQELKDQLGTDYILQDAEIETEVSDVKGVVSTEETNAVNKPEVFGEEIMMSETESLQIVRRDSAETNSDSGNAPAQQFAQDFINQLAEAVENVDKSTTSYGVSGQEIIRQITEQIKIHVKQDTTEMELQLHPASLGNVKVQLTSASGVLTAVFTTENEAVKAALESQLIQLKENFTQQGLKVESVEVNVSAQGFERSLDQQEQEQNRFEESKNKKSVRRIRLGGLEEAEELLAEEMSADDRIVADMMIRNGNTVDYTV